MIKIRYVLLFLFVLLSVSFSFSQNSKELEASFVKGGKNIEDVDYYLPSWRGSTSRGLRWTVSSDLLCYC